MLTPGISPMAFALNNPVSLVDPTGLMAETQTSVSETHEPPQLDWSLVFEQIKNSISHQSKSNAPSTGHKPNLSKNSPTIKVLLMDDNRKDAEFVKSAWKIMQQYLERWDNGEPVCFNLEIVKLAEFDIKNINKNDALIIVGENRKTIIDLVASWGGEYEQWANHTEVQNWRNWNKGKNDFPEIANNPNRAGCPQNINIGVIDRNTTVFTQAPELVMMHILGHNAGMDHGYYAGYGFVPYHGIMYATPSKTNYVRYYRPEKTDSQFKDILEDNKLWKHILKQRFF